MKMNTILSQDKIISLKLTEKIAGYELMDPRKIEIPDMGANADNHVLGSSLKSLHE
jgi:hypothetical protein